MAPAVEERFRHHKHCLLATIRASGAPRVSGIEVWWWEDDVWLGLMPGSLKGSDLRRDPRFELHSAPTDLGLAEPDARLYGRARLVTDEPTITAFAATLPHPGPPPHEMDLFRLDLNGAVLVRVEGDELVLDSWEAGSAPRHHRRR